MIHRFLLCMFLFMLVVSLVSIAQPAEPDSGLNENRMDDNWVWNSGPDEGGGGSAYLGVDIADVSAERLGALKLKEEHGAEITMVDEDAPAGKAGLHEHDVVLRLNGAMIDSAAQLRRMIKETPAGRVVSLGISRDGQLMTIKVQLADRHKSMAWEPHMPEMPAIPAVPSMPDFDVPISVVMVHSSLRSGLMVENITSQLGDFFGVKDGKGVLVRSVEKGGRGDKAGFRAGDVIVKVNGQSVHDTSDFTHVLRSSSGAMATVTVMRDKHEQTLTLTLPEKKDSGSLLENSFDLHDFTAETEQAINRAGDEIALLGPAIAESVQQQAMCWKDAEKKLQDSRRAMRESQRKMQEEQRKIQRLRHEQLGAWAEI
jgi:serine protease Do